jgi:hypothetical protein
VSFGSVPLNRHMRVIVPRPLQSALVHTRHRLLPHRRRDKRLHRRCRRIMWRRHLGSRPELAVHVLKTRRVHAARRAHVEGARLGCDRRRGGLDLGRAE